jgi:hypothetical protein
MSEYQYYEFLAIDRALTAEQIAEVKLFSSRATITRTSFANEYSFGDFRGNPKEFLTRYFDAMVYITNWGTHQFMFSIPTNLVDAKAIEPYCCQQGLTMTTSKDRLILDISLDEEESGDWVDGSGHMASLAGLRAEVLNGDYRPLFLAWLVDLQRELIDAKSLVPPMPAGMRKLSAAQQALVEFLKIDGQLIRMIAAKSPDAASEAFDVKSALARLSPADKDKWLLELIEINDPNAALRLKLKLHASMASPAAIPVKQPVETAGAMLEQYQAHTRELDQRLREKREAERKLEKTKAAAARQQYLDQLATNIPGAWRNLEQMIGLRSQEGYKQAVELLTNLRDLANRPGGDPAAFKSEMSLRLADHSRKQSFMKMVANAGLN